MLKIEIFKTLMKEEEEETLYTLLRSLYTYIEPFYNYSREAEMFYYLLTYLKTSGKNKRKKLTLNDLKPYWTEYSTTLKRDLTDYDNIYFENLGPSAINQIQLIDFAFKDENADLKDYINPFKKIAEITKIMSDSMVINFKNLVEQESGIKILWETLKR